jgi:hypothetical protein
MLELSDRSQYLEEHSADGGGGVDALVEHHQVDLAGLQQVGQLEEVFQRSAEPVEFGDQ